MKLGDEISTVLKTLSTVTGQLRGIRELERDMNLMQVRQDLMAAYEATLIIKEQMLLTKEELSQAKIRIKELESAAAGRVVFRRIDGLLRELDAAGNPTEVRLCGTCNGDSGKLIPMQPGEYGWFYCQRCKAREQEVSKYGSEPPIKLILDDGGWSNI